MKINKKYSSTIIIILLLLIAIISNSSTIAYDNSDIKLNGEINASLRLETFGSVHPTINISENQTLIFNTTKDENNNYKINTTLKININITKNENKEYYLGRYLTTLTFIIRFSDEEIENNIFNLFQNNKLIWDIHRINILNINNSTIKIPLNYKTSNHKENIAMYTFCLGSPGNVFSSKEPIFTFQQTHLNFVYDIDIITDNIPPETSCSIEEID